MKKVKSVLDEIDGIFKCVAGLQYKDIRIEHELFTRLYDAIYRELTQNLTRIKQMLSCFWFITADFAFLNIDCFAILKIQLEKLY